MDFLYFIKEKTNNCKTKPQRIIAKDLELDKSKNYFKMNSFFISFTIYFKTFTHFNHSL